MEEVVEEVAEDAAEEVREQVVEKKTSKVDVEILEYWRRRDTCLCKELKVLAEINWSFCLV